MPENPIIPPPSELFGEPKRSVSKIPPPDELFSDKSNEVANEPYYKLSNDVHGSNEIEGALQMIKKSARRNVTDADLTTLKDVLINPQATEQQRKDAIGVIQGYAHEHKEGHINPATGKEYEFAPYSYYVAPDKNGVLMPKALKYGEKPPEGYHAASVWGTQKDANDDAWYTDIAKGLANGVVNVAKGLAATSGLVATEISGSENKRAQDISNALESLKFVKDEDLKSQIYNSEGVNQWADLIDKKRFDFSPKALWGTLNSAVESLSAFGGGAALTNSAFLGSFLAQISDDVDAAKDAGLKGRDAASMALLKTSIKAGLDASFGLEGMLFRGAAKEAEKNIFKQIAKGVEKNADGLITEQGFKQVAKELVPQYASLAKQIVSGTGQEMLQEATQEFTDVAAEQLWDKLSDKDKAKFGSDITSPKAFARYMDSFINSVGMAPIAGKVAMDKKRYEQQSIAAYNAVRTGNGEVEALKKNIELAKDRGELTEQEAQQANFKIDAYDTYNKQTKDLNLDDKEKKDAFELSFNIEALKSEIPNNKEELDALDPIALAKIDNKKELIKGLQKQLNDMLLPKTVEKETKVGQKTAETIVKNDEKKKTTPTAAELLAKVGGIKSTKGLPIEEEETVTRRKIADVPTEEWNSLTVQKPLEIKKIVQEHLKTTPNNEMEATIRSGQNDVLTLDIGDNKQLRFAQSAKSIEGKSPDFLNRGALPKTKVQVEDRGGDSEAANQGKPEFYYKEPVAVKRLEVDGVDGEGNPMRKAVLSVYNKETGEHIGFVREHDKGKSEYSPEEQKQLQAIVKANHLTDEVKPFLYKEGANKNYKKPVKETKVKEVDYDKLAAKAETEKELDAIIDQADKAEFPIDFDVVNKRRQRIIKDREAKEAKEAKAKKKEAKEVPDKKEKNKTLNQLKEELDKEIEKNKPKNIEEEKAAEITLAHKPKLELKTPTTKLYEKVKVETFDKDTGEPLGEEQLELRKVVAQIKKRFSLLEYLNKCVHGA